MPNDVQMGGVDTDRIFLDTDGDRRFHVKDIETDSTGATAKNIAGWTIVFDIRTSAHANSALLSATCSTTGSFNSVAASNTQRAVWTFADTDLTTAIFGRKGGTFYYSLKRTDSGSETILQYGTIVIERATQV